MSVSQSSSKTSVQGFGLALAVSIAVNVLMAPCVMAQVGPIQPPKRPQAEGRISKAIEKMLAKKKEGKDGDKTTTDGAPVDGKEPPATPEAAGPAVEEEEPAKPTAPPKDFVPGVVAIPQRGPMLTQPPLTSAKIETPTFDTENPPVMNHPKLDDPNNPLGLVDAQNRLKRLTVMLDASRFAEAKPGLAQLRQWLVEVTEAHIGLYKTLNQIPSARAQAELEKTLALEFAQLRDRTMMENARIYISEKEYSKAVKELAEVVKSQPKSKVGLRSYEMLQEIGFTEKLQLAQ